VEQKDLGALFARMTRRIIDAERPLLAARGLSMWAYIALTQLDAGPADTQQALAQAIDHDKTRIITLLDGLEADGLITREPDPADRRARIVTLTAAGRKRLRAAQSDIRAMESGLLEELSVRQQRDLRSILKRLDADAD
jgi:DNA-binding MarR family transcriptional regulator